MQLRYETGLTGEAYVRTQAWRDATLERCPNHLNGGCSLARHGTYTRKSPRGTRVARWYCPESHTTFSLLPDCLVARLPGELDEVEQVVVHAEQAPSLAAAGDVRNPHSRFVHRQIVEMRISRRGFHLGVTEQAADHRQAAAERQRLRSVAATAM